MAKFYIIKIRTFAITSLEQAKQLVYCQYRKRSKVSSVCPCQRDGGPTLNTLNLLLSISVVVHQPLCQRDGGPTLNTLNLLLSISVVVHQPLCQRHGGPTLNTLNLLLSISVVVHQPLCQRDGGPTLNTLDLDVAFYISSSTPTPFIFRFVFQHSVQRT